jgi:hypothetical protein
VKVFLAVRETRIDERDQEPASPGTVGHSDNGILVRVPISRVKNDLIY